MGMAPDVQFWNIPSGFNPMEDGHDAAGWHYVVAGRDGRHGPFETFEDAQGDYVAQGFADADPSGR